jgi:hypothetical protein
VIEGFLAESHEGVRRAAVGYLISRGSDPTEFARRLLYGDDPTLRQYILDALFDHPYDARGVLTWSWIDARLGSGRPEDMILAARALGAMEGPTTVRYLRSLIINRNVDIQRVALLSAARQPSPELLDVLLPLLIVPEVSNEAREAVAAVGDPAMPELERLLNGELGPRAQGIAARVLSRIASPGAVDCLMTLARGGDVGLRHIGLQGMMRARLRTGRPVLPRSTVHRLFLRELRDYRVCLAPVASLEKNPAAAVRLLGETYHESADRALERALQALACWYDPKPLIGVFDRLKSRDIALMSPALEYLGHVLPRAVFRPVSRIFEEEAMDASGSIPDTERLDEWIREAWKTGDAWLRACAVRASRYAPGFDSARFATADEGDPMVRAEIDALSSEDRIPTVSRQC